MNPDKEYLHALISLVGQAITHQHDHDEFRAVVQRIRHATHRYEHETFRSLIVDPTEQDDDDL